MAAADSYSPNPDETDPQAAVRRRVLAQQQGGDPTAPATDSAAPAAASAPVASAPFQASAKYATSYGDGTTSPDQSEPTPSAPAPAAQGAPNTPAPGNPANEIQGYYTRFLGRNANDQEIQSHLGNPGGLSAVQNLIANSPEAQAYAAAHAAPAPATGKQASDQHNTGGGSPAPQTTAQTYASVNSNTLPSNPFQDLVRSQIMERLKAASAPVDPNAPEIAAAMTGSQAALDRQQKLQRSQTAERLYAQNQGGLNTDALGRNIQQSNERNATAQGQLKATLVMNHYNQQRSELQNLYQLAVSSNDADSARMVQLQLAALQAQLAREGYGVQMGFYAANANADTTKAGAGG